MLAWFRRLVFPAAFAVGLVAAGTGAPCLVQHGGAAWNAVASWMDSDGPAVKRAAFIVAGGPVRPGQD